jgi:hypothetical protein
VDDHVALGRVLIKGDRRHRTTARVSAVARLQIDMQRPQAVEAVIAVTAAGERHDMHAAMRTGKGRVFGVPADGLSSRVEVIFKLERPRVPCVLALAAGLWQRALAGLVGE